MKQSLCKILSFKVIRTVYVTLIESLIIYDIFGWVETYDNAYLQLQKFQNTMIKVVIKKYWKYLTNK